MRCLDKRRGYCDIWRIIKPGYFRMHEREEGQVFKRNMILGLLLLVFLTGFAPAASAEGETAQAVQSVSHDEEDEVYYKVTLRYGTRGEDVKLLQSYLIRTGFLRDKADGVFGNATLRAVKEFQKATGLTINGIVGPQTLKALKLYGSDAVSRGRMGRSLPPDAAAPKQISAEQSAEQVRRMKMNPPEGHSPAKVRSVPESKPMQEAKPQDNLPAHWSPIRLEATAYTRHDTGCTDWTYRGNYLQRGLVAVDPRIIPLGTRLYVPGYGFAIADDVGGAIRGHKIDLAMDTQAEAFTFGRRQLTAYIIDWRVVLQRPVRNESLIVSADDIR